VPLDSERTKSFCQGSDVGSVLGRLIMRLISLKPELFARTIAAALIGIAAFIYLPGAMAATGSDPELLPQSSNEVVAHSIERNRKPVIISWQARKPKAILIAIHGFGLHKAAYEQFAQQMQQRGISTYALDVRGFGGWMQSDGSSPVSFSKTLEDLRLLVRLIRVENSNAPVFLVGESMGGAIALAFSAENPSLVDGVISSAPANGRFKPIRTALRIGADFLLTGGGKINLDNVLVERASKNEELRKSWESDEQAKLKVTLRELLRFRKFMKETRGLARTIKQTPVLVVQGQMDKLVKPSSTEKLFRELPTRDKELLVVENGEHLTLEEGQFDKSLLDSIEVWIANHKERQAIVAANR